MELAYAVMLGIALAAGPSLMMLFLFGWVGWEWFKHELHCINKLMDDIREEKDGGQF